MSQPRRGIIVDLFKEQAGLCCYCTLPMTLKLNKRATATIDHIKPKFKGGGNLSNNFAAACHSCNQLKGSRDLVMFLLEYGSLLRSPSYIQRRDARRNKYRESFPHTTRYQPGIGTHHQAEIALN